MRDDVGNSGKVGLERMVVDLPKSQAELQGMVVSYAQRLRSGVWIAQADHDESGARDWRGPAGVNPKISLV